MSGQEVQEPGIGIIDELATALMDQWAKSEPEHSITKNPTSYVATFVELARAAYLIVAAGVRAEERRRVDAFIADRLAAPVGTTEYGVSALIALRADIAAAGSAVPPDRRQLVDVIAAALCAQEEALDADDDGGTWRGWSTDDVAEMLASAVQATPQAGSAVPVATPGRVETATVAAQALMGVVGEIDDLTTAELVTRRAMQFEQEARDLTPVATPTEPDVEQEPVEDWPAVCPGCGALAPNLQLTNTPRCEHWFHRPPTPEQDGQR